MRKKKLIAIFLVIVTIFSMFPMDFIFAYPTPEWISFDFDSKDFQYAYFDTEATAGTGIKFRTIGWNIKFRTSSSASWREVYVPVDPSSALKLSYTLYLSQPGYENNISDNTNERVKYSIEHYVGSNDKDAYYDVLYNGGEWFFNARIQVYINGSPQSGKIANTLEEAVALESWGDNTINDFHQYYYNRPGTSKPEPIPNPDFDILYKGNIVNGKTVEKDMADLRIILQDKTYVPSTANPVKQRTWYYWNVESGWDEISSTGTNDTTVTIDNCDTDLPGSKPLKKAFKLVVKDSYGYEYPISGDNYQVEFTISKGSITAHYIDANTGSRVYDDTVMENLAFGTYTISPKTAPAGYTIVNSSSKSVTISQSDPVKDVYFYYVKNTAPSEQGIIVVYYKDNTTGQDIVPCETYVYDYGTHQVTAKDLTYDNYNLISASPVSVTLDASNKYKEVTFLYQPNQPADINKPPIAIINAPMSVYAGESFHVDGDDSYDPDGYIVKYEWDYENPITGNTLGNDNGGSIWLPWPSDNHIGLDVWDNDDLRDRDNHGIEVLPPIPIAKVQTTGKLKVNRKVTLSDILSWSPDHYPLDHTKSTWGSTAATTDIKYNGTLIGSPKDILFKQAGNKQITLKVYNTCTDSEHPDGFYDTETITVPIAEDLVPRADFSAPSIVSRNPGDSNYATITAANTSTSPDGDTIGKTVMFYCYDSDNDGNYDEETWYYSTDGATWKTTGMAYTSLQSSFDIYSLSASSPATFKLKTNQVGKYKFEMKVIEAIPESETISSFISPSDYKRGDTFTTKALSSKIVEVVNTAPTFTFEANKNVPIDLMVMSDYPTTQHNALVSQVNSTKTGLIPYGIYPNVSYFTSKKNVAERKVDQYRYQRFIKITVDGYKNEVDGDIEHIQRVYYKYLETLSFYDDAVNLPDRSKYSYDMYAGVSEREDEDGDDYWPLLYSITEYYDGQNTGRYSDSLHELDVLAKEPWSDMTQVQEDSVIVQTDFTYATTFKKSDAPTGSKYVPIQGLDADALKNSTFTSDNRYLLIAAMDYWNFAEVNQELQDYVKASKIKTYIVGDAFTLNNEFYRSGITDIRYVNSRKAYEIDGKLYQYSRVAGTYSDDLLKEIAYAARDIPVGQASITIPMHDYVMYYTYRTVGHGEDRETVATPHTVTDNPYNTTVSIVNGSVTVGGTTISNVKALYGLADCYLIELNTGEIYYFKRYLKYYTEQSDYIYYHYHTKFSAPKLISGANGVRTLRSIPCTELSGANQVVDAETVFFMDNNGNVYTATRRKISDHYGDTPMGYGHLIALSSTDLTLFKTGVSDFIMSTTPTVKTYYLSNGSQRSETIQVAAFVDYINLTELTDTLKYDTYVNFYSIKTLVPLKNLFDGFHGGIYGAWNYSQALTDIANDAKSATSSTAGYVLLGEKVHYSKFYADYEFDPQYAETWKYTHYPSYFDTSLGLASFNGQTLTSPVAIFDKVGKYIINAKARDNPKNNLKFLNDTNEAYNYYKWSTGNQNFTLYVHRKPVAMIRMQITANGNGTYTVKALDGGSYDLDHTSRADKGIAEWEWSWREGASTLWTSGQMSKTDCTKDKIYYIRLRVKDLEGAWSDYDTVQIDRDNPPEALFIIEKPIISTTEYLKVKDLSFPQSFSTITNWHWIVNRVNADGSETKIFAGQAAESNTGTGSLSGYDKHVKYSYNTTGKYKVYLRVQDSNGLWSDGGTDGIYNLDSFYSRGFEVDKPPVASFTVEKNPIKVDEALKLKDTSAATGTSPLAQWHWIVKKLNPDGSVQGPDIQNERFAGSNTGIGAMLGYDVNVKTNFGNTGAGTYRIYLRVMNANGYWSDGGTDKAANLGSCFSRDIVVEESLKMSNFRVVRVRDLHLDSYYYNPASGKYDDRPMNVNEMAIDYQNFGGLVDGLTKGYLFEYEIDTVNFNDSTDTIVIVPHFYTCDAYSRDEQERDLYWENSYHEILKAGEGGHSKWAAVTLDTDDRTVIGENTATWRGSYLIPGTAWAVPAGTSPANAEASRINRDIIVNFEIKGYKDGVMKYNYNLQQWLAERTTGKWPYEVGDVIRYSHTKCNLDDNNVILNRP